MALPEFSMRTLLEAGAHFGHQTHRWNPKMERYIFGSRSNIHIIDLSQTVPLFARALEFVSSAVASGGKVLFVGTKRQAQEVIAEQAQRVGMPYVNQRWLGGMLTNFQTIHKRLQRLKEIEDMEQTGVLVSLSKNEQLVLSREKAKREEAWGRLEIVFADNQPVNGTIVGRPEPRPVPARPPVASENSACAATELIRHSSPNTIDTMISPMIALTGW